MKERREHVVFDFGQPVALNQVEHGKDGSIRLFAASKEVRPEAAWIDTSYKRTKKDKVLNRIPIPTSELNSNLLFQLHRCSTLVAIDTNTKKVGGETVSVSSAVWAIVEPRHVEFGHMGGLELRNVNGSPERVAWSLLVEQGATYKTPVGVIVDSELDLLHAINRREEPIERGIFLPVGWTLMYASADTGATLIPNRLIRQCDRRSSSMLNWIANDMANRDGLVASADSSFTHVRRWKSAA